MNDHDPSIDIQAVSRYLADQSDPDDHRYVFAYTVRLQNRGSQAAQLISRHWVITDGNGKVEEVRGDGVVGKQPVLEPGESFEYSSGAVLETAVGSMHGSYHMQAEDGTAFDAAIPTFTLSVPRMLN
ncbi:Co2+/Mg2+ efflux protein ApaG [Pseudomarimonas arenosa]|uniref:Protein ApaG n=1 Tax=Pseudomarimonas arenosa TaxID=2774145 RepID=A0AAW3ZFY4_9GAMM|nr:Co2+/Mg2+ efflux protein ApaG [Pseudomarimonas arenosa]MBD8524244.1 Co2+/Mg2+ efflux protein ApaG [Pseudomarimonas arenosa]